MKRSFFSPRILLALVFTFVSVSASLAGIEPMSKEQLSNLSDGQAEARAAELSRRVNEINNMDVKSLSRQERKEIKSEMREIKKELDFLSNRVTLSLGAVIIIVLLIILIF